MEAPGLSRGTFTDNGETGFTTGPSSKLWPFRKDKDTFYTSADVLAMVHRPKDKQVTGELGYVYPELADKPDMETLMQRVRSYGRSSRDLVELLSVAENPF
jgi:hypothetical protein